jgi:hypothetical protein
MSPVTTTEAQRTPLHSGPTPGVAPAVAVSPGAAVWLAVGPPDAPAAGESERSGDPEGLDEGVAVAAGVP